MEDPVVVIGGGIGGLTAALALTHHGVPCHVYERASELAEVGAGVALWPRALAVLDRLGLGPDVRALSQPFVEAGIRRHDGRWLFRYRPEEMAAVIGGVPATVHRGELQSVLLAALPPGVVHTGSACTEVLDVGGDRARVRISDDVVVGRLVVGADGLGSRVRASVFGDVEPRDCRYVGWRGTLDRPSTLAWVPSTVESWGPSERFGIMPLSGDRLTWFATARRFRDGGGRAELLARFRSWHDPIASVLEATPDDAIWRDRIYDRPSLRHWTRGRVTLLGDAAHPMTPELGQGACQAIEDAWALADCVAGAPDILAGLAAYERRRRRRTGFVARVAHVMAVVNNTEHRGARRLRDGAVGAMPNAIALRQLRVVAGR